MISTKLKNYYKKKLEAYVEMHWEQAWDHLGSIEEKNDMILQDIWYETMMTQKYCRYKLIKIIQYDM